MVYEQLFGFPFYLPFSYILLANLKPLQPDPTYHVPLYIVSLDNDFRDAVL